MDLPLRSVRKNMNTVFIRSIILSGDDGNGHKKEGRKRRNIETVIRKPPYLPWNQGPYAIPRTMPPNVAN